MATSSGMSSVSILFFFLSAVLFSGPHTQVTAGVDFVLPVCKSACGGDQYVGIQFCVDTLRSDGRSRNTSDTKEFVVVAVDHLTASATSTKAKIDGLLRGKANGRSATTPCLQSCQALYQGILGLQPACAAAVKDGKFAEATISLEKSAAAAKECESLFGQSHVTSPLTAEDDNAFQLAKLGVALIRQLI
jgi:pectinesterase inhibitor-like protein